MCKAEKYLKILQLHFLSLNSTTNFFPSGTRGTRESNLCFIVFDNAKAFGVLKKHKKESIEKVEER